jgi:hypothetical protein
VHISLCFMAYFQQPSTVHFRDGIRRIDFVLVYTDDVEKPEKAVIRKIFEKNLEHEGLELEYQVCLTSVDLYVIHNYVSHQ